MIGAERMKIGSFRIGLFCVIITLLIGAELIPGIDANIGKISRVSSAEKALEKDTLLEENDENNLTTIDYGTGLNNATTGAINFYNSYNNPTWKQINEDGFGTRNNPSSRGLENFGNYLIIGTRNHYCANGSTPFWTRARSNGCEIWCYDGKEMRQLVGNNTEAIMKSGFGNKNNSQCLVLKEFNCWLYCGVGNMEEGCQIWRTKDINETWEMVVERGFGNRNNIGAATAEIFDGYLYIGVDNYVDGGEIYRTSEGEHWEVVVGKDSATDSGFGARLNFYMWSMKTYNSWLYVGTMNPLGCELWKSCDGISWYPVVAYSSIIKAILHRADFPRGFGKISERIIGVREMIVFNDELYLGLAGLDIYVKLSMPPNRIMTFVVSRPFTIGRTQFTPSLAQVWKYNAVNDKWTRIVGGLGERNDSAGFGDPLNNRVYAMEIFDDCLYVGTLHPDPTNVTLKRNGFLNWNISLGRLHGVAEIWRYNGKYWEQILLPDEARDGHNFGIQEMSVFNNSLIIGTFNLQNGCELWEYNT